MGEITVRKDRTNIMEVKLSYDVSGDIIKSQIRKGRNHLTPVIAEWEVRFKNDGKDGALVFTIDNSVSSLITEPRGYMDIMRISAGEPISVTEYPLTVVFQDAVTIPEISS